MGHMTKWTALELVLILLTDGHLGRDIGLKILAMP